MAPSYPTRTGERPKMHADRWLAYRKTAVRPGNYLLRSLDSDTFDALSPHLEILNVPNGYTLRASGDALDYLYFPAGCVLNIQGELADGSTAELTAVSCNGFLGASALIGVRLPWGVVTAVHGGQLARVRRAAATTILRRAPHVLDEMLRYVVFSLHLMSMSVVCQRHHSLDQRLARWLSCMTFLTNDSRFDITHDQLGRFLGVRREGISETMKQFECAGLVASSRGHVDVIDSARLRQRSCGCIDEGREMFMRFFPHRSISYALPTRTAAKHVAQEQRYAEAG